MKQPETKFKEKVIQDLKREFPTAYILKTQERGRRGVPDLLICLNGRMLAIELKVGKGKPTPIQMATLDRIRYAGGFALWTHPDSWDLHLESLKSI